VQAFCSTSVGAIMGVLTLVVTPVVDAGGYGEQRLLQWGQQMVRLCSASPHWFLCLPSLTVINDSLATSHQLAKRGRKQKHSVKSEVQKFEVSKHIFSL
jgi:hypothetical protein